MDEWKIRTSMLIGEQATERLAASHVAVFGVGGVGSYAVEALARAGVGAIDLIDSDTFSESNINRQLYALHSTVGLFKVEVAAKRIKDINPKCIVNTYVEFFLPETADKFDFEKYDCVLDCIDTITGKIELIRRCKEKNTNVISSMGAGNKLCADKFVAADLSETSVCPLAKVMRHELKKYGITHLKVVYSKEEPLKPDFCDDSSQKRQTPGSISFVPSVVGLIMAGEAVKTICNIAQI
ncbi:MAG: tRNA threonylcarbamoyladenosine dehydratase [Clostridia bacterium]